MSKTTMWPGTGTDRRNRTAPPPRRSSPARAAAGPKAITTNKESVRQHFRVMGRSSFSIAVDVVDDGQAVRIVADSGDGRDLPARPEIDDEDGAAGGSGRSLAGAAGHHGVAAVGGHRGPLRAR